MSEAAVPKIPQPLRWTDSLVSTFWRYYATKRQQDYFTYLFGDQIIEKTARFYSPGATVCDYGCGSGHLLEKLLKNNYRTAGYDYTLENLEAVHRRLGRQQNLIGLYTVDSISTPSAQYDVVYVVETVEHVLEEHVPTFTRNLAALLKPGGIVIVTTPHDEDLEVNTVFCPSCQKTFHRWQHIRSFDAARLTQFMRSGGFEAVKVFTTDFAAVTARQRMKARLRPRFGRKNPHLVYVGRKSGEA